MSFNETLESRVLEIFFVLHYYDLSIVENQSERTFFSELRVSELLFCQHTAIYLFFFVDRVLLGAFKET